MTILGNVEFRGEDGAGNYAYAQIIGGILVATNGSEDGVLDLMSSLVATCASRITLWAVRWHW